MGSTTACSGFELQLAFGGKVSGRNFGYVASGSGPRLNLLRIEEKLEDRQARLIQRLRTGGGQRH